MKIKLFFSAFVLVTSGLIGEAYAYGTEGIMNEVTALRQELEILQRKVYRSQADNAGNPQSVAEVAIKMGDFEEKLRRLTGRLDETNYKIKQLENKIDLINKDVDVRIKLLEGKSIQAIASDMPKKSEKSFKAPIVKNAPKSLTGDKITKSEELPPLKGKDIQQIYNEGLDAVKTNNFSVAEQRFNEVLQKAPKDKLAGNAQYWLGEVFYGQKDYPKAAVAFAKVIEHYKDGSKGADSLLKLGMSMTNLKKKEEACQAFLSLKQEFPKAEKPVWDKAKAEAKKLGCQ